jgi:mannan endo-1,4-beta-mannosidase
LDPITWGRTWITRHLTDAKTIGKPAVLEEYGLLIDVSKDIPDEATRANGYREWTNTVEQNAGAGDQFWLLTSRIDDGSYYPDYDGYRIVWRNDDTNTTNDAAQLFAAHAKRMMG